jgi:hypothetical protein
MIVDRSGRGEIGSRIDDDGRPRSLPDEPPREMWPNFKVAGQPPSVIDLPLGRMAGTEAARFIIGLARRILERSPGTAVMFVRDSVLTTEDQVSFVRGVICEMIETPAEEQG